jgi:deazaflavin-dependent oxidoreductase (nitroreductase family)
MPNVDWSNYMERSSHGLHKKFMDGIRIFNKTIFNRITMALAKRGKGPFSIVCHKGRRSGRKFQTPVLASYHEDVIIIPLSYGEDVDWLKNVLAQGGCEIFRMDRKIDAVNPEVIESTHAFASLPEDRRELFQRFKMEKFLRLEGIERR